MVNTHIDNYIKYPNPMFHIEKEIDRYRKNGNSSKSLTAAGVNKKDEFFTQLIDIEEKHYIVHLKNASIMFVNISLEAL